MRLICRDSHDEAPEDRCPPHLFTAAGWDDTEGKWQSAIFCQSCGDVRTLEPPAISSPAMESVDRRHR
jgi:hypothetical protein